MAYALREDIEARQHLAKASAKSCSQENTYDGRNNQWILPPKLPTRNLYVLRNYMSCTNFFSQTYRGASTGVNTALSEASNGLSVHEVDRKWWQRAAAPIGERSSHSSRSRILRTGSSALWACSQIIQYLMSWFANFSAWAIAA